MQKVDLRNSILTSFSEEEIRRIFRDEITNYFSQNPVATAQTNNDEIGGIDLAIEITGKAKATIYSLCSNRQIPHFKKSKKLLFSRNELTEWIKNGRRKTHAEIALEAENFSSTNSKQNKNVMAR
jgi:predicted DNA-binding transcriptional regulator AlpA